MHSTNFDGPTVRETAEHFCISPSAVFQKFVQQKNGEGRSQHDADALANTDHREGARQHFNTQQPPSSDVAQIENALLKEEVRVARLYLLNFDLQIAVCPTVDSRHPTVDSNERKRRLLD